MTELTENLDTTDFDNFATTRTRFATSVLPWLMCALGALFYCYAYFLRVSPSVMVNELIAHFEVNAGSLGILSAFYYYAYTPMQIPVGIIVDRYGARMVLSIAALICSLGVYVFASTRELYIAEIGRFLIGFGSAFGYVTTLKLATLWLPPKRFATAAGSTTAIGMIAAGLSQVLLTDIVERIGYQHALDASIVIGIVLTLVIFLFVRNQPKRLPKENQPRHTPLTFTKVLSYLSIILINPQTWLIGVIGCLMYLPASVFLDLWGIPYLETVYHLSAHDASRVSLVIFIGWIIAGPVTGAVSDMIGKRRLPLLLCSIGAAIVMSVIFYVPGISLTGLYFLAGILGFFCGSHPLCFAISRENISAKVSATAIAVANTLIMIGGMVFQPVVGFLLDANWDGVMLNGSPIYSAENFTYALSIVPISLIISVGLTFFIRETHCRVPE